MTGGLIGQGAVRIVGAVLLAGCAAFAAFSQEAAPQEATQALDAFASEAELDEFLKRRPPPDPAVEADAALEEIVVTGSAVASTQQDSITSVQERGVDEGGIVKLRGDLLVVLRRGRLFTVSIAGGGMRPVDSIDAYPPGVDASSDWYDEMLVAEDRVVVIGYSYGRGGTEINRFKLGTSGELTFEDAYQLKSNDYFSSRNYASRLIDDRLIFYTPLSLERGDKPLETLPQLRRWREATTDGDFKPIAGVRDLYLPKPMRDDDADADTLHTVVSCDLLAPALDCSATGIVGPESRTFYVSRSAVYVWVSDWRWDPRADESYDRSWLYRLPLRGGRAGVLATRGQPTDQFSFREDAEARRVHVLVRSEGGGDAMWRPEFSEGAVALLSVPFASFGDGSHEAASGRYRHLPTPDADSWSFRNRFVGDHVVYGSEADDAETTSLVAARVADGVVARLRLPHGLNRIEVLGRDALAVGSRGEDLTLSTIRLPQAGRARLGQALTLDRAAEVDSRSHAFVFRADERSVEGGSGLLGLPVDRAGRNVPGQALSLAFVRRRSRALLPMGDLVARAQETDDDVDACVASCVDWYGNARPIFTGDRTFALLGYELVEGRIVDDRIREIARVDFTPRSPESDTAR